MSIPVHFPFLSQAEWLGCLSEVQPVATEMLERSDEDQRHLGYFHTFREIGQQPSTWLRTCELMWSHAAEIARPGGWDFVPVAIGIGRLGIRGGLRAWRFARV